MRARIDSSKFRSVESVEHFENYFSKHSSLVERYVDQQSLEETLIPHIPLHGGWQDITTFEGRVPIEAVHLFYANVHNSNMPILSIKTMVYGVVMKIDPDTIATILGICRPVG